jgi:hypothetical protein
MMIKTEFKLLRLLLFFGLSLCSISIFAQVPARTLTVTSTGSLEFGRFSRQNGGTITIDPYGTVSKTGDVFLVNSLRSNVRFDVSTNRGNNNMVTVTANPTPLTGPAGSLELSVFFDKNPFPIDKNNPATVNMGGTLTVGPEDLPGYYTGTVSVIFAYQ